MPPSPRPTPVPARSWPRCSACWHLVNPRSERCIADHASCSPQGCRVDALSWPAHVRLDPAAEEPRGAAASTMHLVDVASYQAGLDLRVVQAAGFSAINIKLSQGNWYTYSGGKAFADTARSLGLGICTFHWLDASAAGTAQAQYAYQQWRAIGCEGTPTAHQVDCEDTTSPATFQILSDYVRWWQDRLGRPVVIYSGDWWWQPRGWTGSTLTRYVWAPPNSGYRTAYPGDQSADWACGYGGWTDYSLLQYSVSPIAGAGATSLSKSAVRDPAVWAALTGQDTTMPLSPDDIAAIWAYAIGGPANHRPAHFALSDLRDMLATDGMRSSYDGQVYGVPKVLAALTAKLDAQGKQLADLAAKPAAALTDAQMAALADKVAAAVVQRTDNPLSDADKPAIISAVKQALREGAGAGSPA